MKSSNGRVESSLRATAPYTHKATFLTSHYRNTAFYHQRCNSN